MNNYSVRPTETFKKSYEKLIKGNIRLTDRVQKTVHLLSENPFHSGLKTHKVTSRNFGEAFSSRVTGDLRIIWSFVGDKLVISMLDIGGHDAGGVYK